MSEREAFELWAKDTYRCSEHSFECSPDGYVHTVGHRALNSTYANVQMLWEAWRAGVRSQAEELATLRASTASVQSDQRAENDLLRKHLRFVERWANHHGGKPNITPAEVLSTIQHYPPIKEITRSYADGVVPATFDPWARVAELEGALRDVLDEQDACEGYCSIATNDAARNSLESTNG